MTQKKEQPKVTEQEEVDDSMAANSEGGFKFDTDFNIEQEFKVAPLIPTGQYGGHIIGVKFDAADMALVWDVSLIADPDEFMTDNETPVSGNVIQYKNYFPKAGDELVRTKSGKQTKRQAKINMIADFQKKMKVDMNTAKAIEDGVQNAEWIGIQVIVSISIREWEGRFNNQIVDIAAA
jgi:hypothetical protein